MVILLFILVIVVYVDCVDKYFVYQNCLCTVYYCGMIVDDVQFLHIFHDQSKSKPFFSAVVRVYIFVKRKSTFRKRLHVHS